MDAEGRHERKGHDYAAIRSRWQRASTCETDRRETLSDVGHTASLADSTRERLSSNGAMTAGIIAASQRAIRTVMMDPTAMPPE